MADSLGAIKAPIVKELEEFEQRFKGSMKSSVPLLDRITHYIVQRKGKQMRPMFVLLSAKMLGEISERTYRAAAMIELLHTATLVHDDVVDDANTRRGFFSINALWKNKIAVLVGDYLLSKGLLLSLDNNDFDLLKMMSEAVKEMSEGELLQMEKARKLDITEEVYFNIIRQKTASLISAACGIGAASVIPEDTATIEKVKAFGGKIGMAFQIRDDLFDYGEAKIGKPVGIDIQERKMTLPLIYALREAKPKDAKRMLSLVRNHNKDKKRVKEVIAFVKDLKGPEYAIEIMNKYQAEAIEILHTLPENESRKSIEDLVYFTTRRKL